MICNKVLDKMDEWWVDLVYIVLRSYMVFSNRSTYGLAGLLYSCPRLVHKWDKTAILDSLEHVNCTSGC